MKDRNTDPPDVTPESGTPLDYSSDVYRVYVEVCDPDGTARRIIADFLGAAWAAGIQPLAHGYELELPIQCIPEIVRLLVAGNVAVYQLVRLNKTDRLWH